jgi:hypothetical protein
MRGDAVKTCAKSTLVPARARLYLAAISTPAHYDRAMIRFVFCVLLSVSAATSVAAQDTPTLEHKLRSAVANNWHIRLIQQDSTIIEGRAVRLNQGRLEVGRYPVEVASVARFERRIKDFDGRRTGAIIGATLLAAASLAVINVDTPAGRRREPLPTLFFAVVGGGLVGLLVGEAVSSSEYEWVPQYP